MDWTDWARALAALVATLALIGGAALVARRFGALRVGVAAGPKRIRVVDSAMIDPRRRLVIVRCDAREHLLLLSPTGDVAIASGDAPLEAAPDGSEAP